MNRETAMEELRQKGDREFRPTTDDWYPNWPGDMVYIRMCPLSNGLFRVCVWGADDTGMEIDVKSKEEAQAIYNSLPPIISKKDLKERGFYSA